MRVERIERLLGSQPPDEPPYRGELILGPRVMQPSRQPVRGRWPAAGALTTAVVVVALLGIGVAILGPLAAQPTNAPSASSQATGTPAASPPLAAIPWIDATPPPPPTPEPSPDPRLLPACTSSDLVLMASGWEGATGSLAGGAIVINLGSNPCTVAGKPGVELLDSRGAIIARGAAPEASSGSALVVLPTGAGADVITVWSNWCDRPPSGPLRIRVSLPMGRGELAATVRERALNNPILPRCDSPGSGSTIGVPLELASLEPSSGGSQPESCIASALGAYLSQWGAAAGTLYANLVVVNLGDVDCRLDATATLELRDAGGQRVVEAASETRPAPAATPLLPPGWAAAVRVGYSDWCTPPPALPLRADLLIGSDRVAVQAQSAIPVPACMADPATPPPTMFFDGALTVPGSPPPPEPDPGDSLPVSVTLSPLPPTTPGGSLDYSVTLTNTMAFDKPLNLAADCPTYTQRLFVPGARASVDIHLALNCGPAGLLAPHVPVTFTMRLPIPADSPPGSATLVWQLGDRGPAVKTTFEIRP